MINLTNQTPIEFLALLIILPFTIFVFVVLHEKLLEWNHDKIYDRLLTLVTSLMTALIFTFINDSDSISLMALIILILVGIATLYFYSKKTSNKKAANRKIYIITAYSVLITTFFYINFPNDSSKGTIEKLEKIGLEFKSKDSFELNSLITQNIDEIKKEKEKRIEREKDIAFIALFLSIAAILLLESKDKEDLPPV